MNNKRNEILNLRSQKHPDWKNEPCAGSVFQEQESSAGDIVNFGGLVQAEL